MRRKRYCFFSVSDGDCCCVLSSFGTVGFASVPLDRFPSEFELDVVLPGSCVGFQRDDANPGHP